MVDAVRDERGTDLAGTEDSVGVAADDDVGARGEQRAGEVLLLIIGTLVPMFASIPFYFLETFVGFIQGFVFALLALVFMTIAVSSHDEHPAEEHRAAANVH